MAIYWIIYSGRVQAFIGSDNTDVIESFSIDGVNQSAQRKRPPSAGEHEKHDDRNRTRARGLPSQDTND